MAKKSSKKSTEIVLANPPPKDGDILPSAGITPKLNKADLISAMIELEREGRIQKLKEAEEKRKPLRLKILDRMSRLLQKSVTDFVEPLVERSLMGGNERVFNGDQLAAPISDWMYKVGSGPHPIGIEFEIPVDDPELRQLRKEFLAIKNEPLLSGHLEEELRKALGRKYMDDRAAAIREVLKDRGMTSLLEEALKAAKNDIASKK